ncbi:MAG: ComEA family DNA-binding protein [Eubacteriales bacterium]|nr:ComEA family DNA-binding protein [Eubacteriales bacterium]
MRDYNKVLKSCSLLFAGFLLLCTGLTGCADREAQFLKENAEVQDSASGDDADSARENLSVGENHVTDSMDSGDKQTVSDGELHDGAVSAQEQNVQQDKAEIYVDVCGAVADPGVYVLEDGSRVFQAVEAAGGFLPEASQTYVNQAKGLEDGQQIYIPTQEEVEQQSQEGQGQAFPVLQADGGGSALADGDAVSEDTAGKVNLNTADEAALTALTGIGASKARAIIAYREENGPFTAIEDIMNVQGIKEGTFAKIKDEIVVG